MTTRFGEPVTYENADAGTVFEYADGTITVSYERNGLFGVKAGHEVVLCLMSIPYDCPDGDGRGHLYYTLDKALNRDWEMVDSQHLCGGA